MPIRSNDDRSEWLASMIDEVTKSCRGEEPEVFVFTAPRDMTVYASSTDRVWKDGRPVTKEFSRGEWHKIFIEKGATFPVIKTYGLASGCRLLYWHRGPIWFTTQGPDVDEILVNSVERVTTEQEDDEFEEYLSTVNTLTLASVMAAVDAAALAGDRGDIQELLLYGLSDGPYIARSEAEIRNEIRERYKDWGSVGLDDLKIHVKEYA